MSRFFLFILLLIINYTHSQDIHTRELLAPDSKSHNDLHFLKDELHNKQLVMLGEMTHMYGNIFEMKARVIEFLHEEMGYNTIAMESPMYDLWKMNKNTSFDPEQFNKTIFGVWGNSLEFQRLVKYIEEKDLKVFGFDSQFGNTTDFIEDFFDYLETQDIALKIDDDDLAIVIESVLEEYSFEEFDLKFSAFEKELKRIIRELESLKSSDSNYHWIQFTKSLLAQSRDAYHNTENILSSDFVNSQHNFRDAQMADNVLSYMKRNPNEKIMLWADNIHVMNSMASITKPVVKDFIPMGSHIKKALGNSVYSLATLHANDSLLEKNIWHKTPLQENSIAYQLKKLDKPYLFISSNQEVMKQTQQHRMLSFVDFMEGRLDQFHDGYIFLNHATVAKPNLPEEKDKEVISEAIESPTDTSKAQSRKIGEVTYFKGQIIDAETKQPVGYANLIMKNEAIYRLSDENGHFEFPQYKDTSQNAIISVSSMGYVTKDIPLNQLTATLILSPSLDELDEITITAHRTPKSVLKEALKKMVVNHPTTPFNYQRYSNVIMNQNDETLLDIDLVTDEYDQGYRQQNRLTQRVEQIKWNTNEMGQNIKSTWDIYNHRQNAIRYSNILHKRKYKKFDLNFIKSNRPEDEGLYIIEFSTDRNKWNYTNRGYPTDYKGKVYIDKANLAIVKVIENWETTLDQAAIEKYQYYRSLKRYADMKEVKIKEENICNYTMHDDKKYYASSFFRRSYTDFTNKNSTLGNSIFELNSVVYGIETDAVEAIAYDHYRKDESLLRRVQYNADFWDTYENETYLRLKN